MHTSKGMNQQRSFKYDIDLQIFNDKKKISKFSINTPQKRKWGKIVAYSDKIQFHMQNKTIINLKIIFQNAVTGRKFQQNLKNE